MIQSSQNNSELVLPFDFPHQPPKECEYKVQPFKRNIIAIWLHNYTVTLSGNPYSPTIWGFYSTKKGQYYSPITSTEQGNQVNLNRTTPYSAMVRNLNPLELALL